MPDQFTIYRQQADRYDLLKAREDYRQHLLVALSAIRSFDRVDIVEWGAGTGWLSALVAPQARSLIACDLNPHMLQVAAKRYRQFEHLRWQRVAADHRQAPLPDRVADVALAGWTLCYLAGPFVGETWQMQISQSIAEMQRVLRPGGTIIIVETLGTGCTEPAPPAAWFVDYYAFLENELGFQSTWVRTDYQFASLDEAVDLLSFFWDDEFGETARCNNWIITPECTGLWWKAVPE
jgi:ubiquinone/menaquinone biosynthesis C-methylase UbiE